MSMGLLPNKMSWETYKKTSMYNMPPSPEGSIKGIYSEQAKIQKAKFNQKYFGITDSNKKDDIAKAEVAKQLVGGYINTYLQPALNSFAADFSSVDKQKGSKYVDFQTLLGAIAAGRASGTDVSSQINKLHSLLDIAEKFLSFDMPAELSGVLNDADAKKKMLALGLDTASLVKGNPAAVTSYLNVLQIYDNIRKFVDSGMSGTLIIGNGEYVEENFLKGGTDVTDPKTGKKTFKPYRKNEISSRFGGYFGQITGQIFETMATKKMAEALLSVANVVNVGAVTGSTGTKQKDDLEIEVDGKKLNLSMASLIAAANTGAPDSVVFNDSIDTGLSAKKKKMKDSNTVLQTGFGGFMALYGASGNDIYDDYATILRHGIQIGSASSKKETAVVNKYIAAKLANLALGDTVDFMVFLDVVVPKYEFLNTLAGMKRRWLYFDYKTKGYTNNPDTVSGEVKN